VHVIYINYIYSKLVVRKKNEKKNSPKAQTMLEPVFTSATLPVVYVVYINLYIQ
jgi:hypothetical protein